MYPRLKTIRSRSDACYQRMGGQKHSLPLHQIPRCQGQHPQQESRRIFGRSAYSRSPPYQPAGRRTCRRRVFYLPTQVKTFGDSTSKKTKCGRSDRPHFVVYLFSLFSPLSPSFGFSSSLFSENSASLTFPSCEDPVD